MATTDRLLTTVLGLYPDVHDATKTDQILGTTATLLTTLTNPLNVSLLTSHFLAAPAVWGYSSYQGQWRRRARHDDAADRTQLKTCLRVMSVYSSAARRVRESELEKNSRSSKAWNRAVGLGGGLGTEAWARAVAKGADERSARYQHLLMLAGVLTGLEGDGSSSNSAVRQMLEDAIARAANLALQETHGGPSPAASAVVLALAYVFPLLSAHDGGRAMRAIDVDVLLPTILRAAFGQADGLQDGIFLGVIGTDIEEVAVAGSTAPSLLSWPPNSPSFLALQRLTSQPLVGALGPLSRLAAFAIEHARSSAAVLQAQEQLLSFSAHLLQHWSVNRLSEVEVSEEASRLAPQTLQHTWPLLQQLLKNIMYAIVATLQAIVARSLVDPHLRHGPNGAGVAAKSLHILRCLYFISSRPGNSAFQVYTFTYMASIDLLSRDPRACAALLKEIARPEIPSGGHVPPGALDRTFDLFYLNLAEHLPLSLSPEECDSLIVRPATVYLTHAATTPPQHIFSPRMIELFELAHSAVLSVLCCPHNAPVTVGVAPFYAETLFASFPARISSRQFRMAFKTMMQILSPPFPISATHPDLGETLLEMIRIRSETAGTAPLPPSAEDVSPQPGAAPLAAAPPMSEQAALVLTMVDSLPFLPLPTVEEWMTITAATLHHIADRQMREAVKQRFWDILVSGEMDVERAAIGVAWWGTKGGRERVLFGGEQQPPDAFMMSGALGAPHGGEATSKL